MANTYTQLYIQFVFAVENRQSLILDNWEVTLYQYITGIVQATENKMIAINGMPDHVHAFIGLNPKQSISDLMEVVKANSSRWINANRIVAGRFNWQKGYGAFSYSRSHIDNVYNYIKRQKAHHKHDSFMNEYRNLLIKFGVEYNPQYLFHEVLY